MNFWVFILFLLPALSLSLQQNSLAFSNLDEIKAFLINNKAASQELHQRNRHLVELKTIDDGGLSVVVPPQEQALHLFVLGKDEKLCHFAVSAEKKIWQAISLADILLPCCGEGDDVAAVVVAVAVEKDGKAEDLSLLTSSEGSAVRVDAVDRAFYASASKTKSEQISYSEDLSLPNLSEEEQDEMQDAGSIRGGESLSWIHDRIVAAMADRTEGDLSHPLFVDVVSHEAAAFMLFQGSGLAATVIKAVIQARRNRLVTLPSQTEEKNMENDPLLQRKDSVRFIFTGDDFGTSSSSEEDDEAARKTRQQERRVSVESLLKKFAGDLLDVEISWHSHGLVSLPPRQFMLNEKKHLLVGVDVVIIDEQLLALGSDAKLEGLFYNVLETNHAYTLLVTHAGVWWKAGEGEAQQEDPFGCAVKGEDGGQRSRKSLFDLWHRIPNADAKWNNIETRPNHQCGGVVGVVGKPDPSSYNSVKLRFSIQQEEDEEEKRKKSEEEERQQQHQQQQETIEEQMAKDTESQESEKKEDEEDTFDDVPGSRAGPAKPSDEKGVDFEIFLLEPPPPREAARRAASKKRRVLSCPGQENEDAFWTDGSDPAKNSNSDNDILSPIRMLKDVDRVVISHLDLDMVRDVAVPLQQTLILLGMPTIREELGMYQTPGNKTDLRCGDLIITIGQSFMNDPLHRFIVFNLEQLEADHFNARLHSAVVSARALWEFSFVNVRYWKRKGLRNVAFMPFSPFPWSLRDTFAPLNKTAEEAASDAKRGVHGVFIGSICPRRQVIYEAFQDANVDVDFHMRWNIWNDQRNRLIDNAAVVVNIHCYPAAAQETLRLVATLGRSACIVSERSTDPRLDEIYGACLHLVSPAEEGEGEPEIISRTRYLLSNETAVIECKKRALPCLRSLRPTMFDALSRML